MDADCKKNVRDSKREENVTKKADLNACNAKKILEELMPLLKAGHLPTRSSRHSLHVIAS